MEETHREGVGKAQSFHALSGSATFLALPHVQSRSYPNPLIKVFMDIPLCRLND